MLPSAAFDFDEARRTSAFFVDGRFAFIRDDGFDFEAVTFGDGCLVDFERLAEKAGLISKAAMIRNERSWRKITFLFSQYNSGLVQSPNCLSEKGRTSPEWGSLAEVPPPDRLLTRAAQQVP